MPVQHLRRFLLLAAVSLTAALLVIALVIRQRLDGTLSNTAVEIQGIQGLAFTLRPLVLPRNPGFAPVLERADLRFGVLLENDLFLAGLGELLQFTPNGTLVRSLRAGSDLPGFPIASLAAGRLHATSPVLLIATSGAGVLLLHPSSGKLEQLLPTDTDLRDITAVAILSNGDLLLGTRRRGVVRFDGERMTLYRPEYRNLAVTAIEATADAVWVGTQADGLLVTRGGVTEHFLSELPDSHVQAFATHANLVFAATPDGVVEFADGKLAQTFARGTFARALSANGRELTMALFEGGVATVPLGATHNRIANVEKSSEGDTEQFLTAADKTYAVRSNGVFRRQEGHWIPSIEIPASSLTDRDIAALAYAPDGRLWVGYFDRGLDIVSTDTGNVHHLEDDHLFCINRIAGDPVRGTMVVATANGLVLFDRAGAPRQVLGTRDGLVSEHVTDVAWSSGSSGSTMVLATPAGLTFVSSSGVESLYAFQGLVNNHVYSIAFSPDDNLVAGTLGGLSVLQHGSVRQNLNLGNSSLQHNWVSALLPMPAFAGAGTLVGTYGGGLVQLTELGQIAFMPGAPQHAVINPNALLATPTHIFAGTLGEGLWSFGRSSGTWQQIVAGLPSLNVTAFAAHNGELVVGTDNGLVRISEAQLPQ